MSVLDMRDIPKGEIRETLHSKWCPFCNKTQMEIVSTKTGTDLERGVFQTTIVWRCPYCYERGY